MAVTLAFLALLIEALIGYPDWLLRAIGHPVTWIGRLIAALDRLLNHETMANASRRAAGVVGVLVLLGAVIAVATALARGLGALSLGALPLGLVVTSLIASTLLAQRSLYAHVARVADALERDGLEAGRATVAHIVGRDAKVLDEAGVARAAIESLAENFSDGVVAPASWLAIGGLSGGAAYKAINTADSMIGHRTPRHETFGWAAARIDDLINLPASRLAALLIVAAAAISPDAHARDAWRATIRDAPRHRSPNAGYPEAAMAGALGLALAGPRVYGGVTVDDALMGDGRRAVTATDIRAALRLYQRADAMLIALLGIAALIVSALT